MTITLSEDQNYALSLLKEELATGNPFVTLGGYAGTGKSTLIPYIAEASGSLSETAFCCFTGKASLVVRKNLKRAGMLDDAGFVGTIHSLIYKLVKEEESGDMIWERRQRLNIWKSDWRRSEDGFDDEEDEESDIKLIVIDEVSMVGKKVLEDLLSFGVQILAVGDPAQLPPVQDESVILDPDVLLTQIHRQAEGNPIIQIATHVREHGFLPKNVQRVSLAEAGNIVEEYEKEAPLDVAILTRSNKVRTKINRNIYGDIPKEGDLVICLKNDWNRGVCNGQRGLISSMLPILDSSMPHVAMQIAFPEEGTRGYFPDVNLPQFNSIDRITPMFMSEKFHTTKIGSTFDFGMAMTVHKAQGSGFKTTIVANESWGDPGEYRKWLYTAVTRATENLYFLPDR